MPCTLQLIMILSYSVATPSYSAVLRSCSTTITGTPATALYNLVPSKTSQKKKLVQGQAHISCTKTTIRPLDGLLKPCTRTLRNCSWPRGLVATTCPMRDTLLASASHHWRPAWCHRLGSRALCRAVVPDGNVLWMAALPCTAVYCYQPSHNPPPLPTL